MQKRKYHELVVLVLTCCMLCSCQGNSLSLDLSETETCYESATEEESTQQEETVAAETESEAEKARVFVHVCGAVGYSDVYEMDEGSRIIDAIKKAGGFDETADANYLNLADVVSDGMKIYVPTVQEVEEGNVPQTIITASSTELVNGGLITDTSAAGSGKVNINTATVEQLKTLNGIGEKRANDIINYRETNGGFKSIEDLKNVSGIGDGVYSKLSNDIEV